MNSYFQRCPKCGKEIYSTTKVCPHCQSKLTFWGKFASALYLFALMANLAMIGVLVYSNSQTRDIIRIQQEQLGLQEKGLLQIDSSLALMAQQLEINREANNLTNILYQAILDDREIDLNQFELENKPDMTITKIDIIKADKELMEHVNIKNIGNSTATDVRLLITQKIENSADTLLSKSNNIKNIQTQKNTVYSFPIDSLAAKSGKLCQKIEIKWKWDYNNRADSIERYTIIIYHEEDSTYSFKYISDNLVGSYWVE